MVRSSIGGCVVSWPRSAMAGQCPHQPAGTVRLVLRLVALWALASCIGFATVTAEDEQAAKRVRIALGAVEGLEAGTVWHYSLRFPKDPFLGAPPRPSSVPRIRRAQDDDDYAKRPFRLVVLQEAARDTGRVLRVDRVSDRGAVLRRGCWRILLSVQEGAEGVTFFRDGRRFSRSAHVAGGDTVPFVWNAYPEVTSVPVESHPTFTRLAGDLLERTSFVDGDKREVEFELKLYGKLDWATARKALADGKDVRYYSKAGSGFIDAPEGEPEDVLPVRLSWVEKQTWDFGAVMWKHMERRTDSGILQFECKRQDAAPEAEDPHADDKAEE